MYIQNVLPEVVIRKEKTQDELALDMHVQLLYSFWNAQEKIMKKKKAQFTFNSVTSTRAG